MRWSTFLFTLYFNRAHWLASSSKSSELAWNCMVSTSSFVSFIRLLQKLNWEGGNESVNDVSQLVMLLWYLALYPRPSVTSAADIECQLTWWRLALCTLLGGVFCGHQAFFRLSDADKMQKSEWYVLTAGVFSTFFSTRGDTFPTILLKSTRKKDRRFICLLTWILFCCNFLWVNKLQIYNISLYCVVFCAYCSSGTKQKHAKN